MSTSAEFNSYHYFNGTLYHKGTQCGRPKHLQTLLHDEMHHEGVRRSFEGLLEKWGDQAQMRTNDDARRRLALRELRDCVSLYSARPDVTDALSAFSSDHGYLNGIMDRAERYYRSIGLEGARAEIFLVDDLPEPYAGRPLAVLAADLGDYKNHGIKPGLYFLRSELRPVIVDYLIAHEAVHAFLGRISPYESCDFFEEGVADLLSVFGCIRSFYTPELAANLYRLYRITSASGMLWDSYVDGSRQALAATLTIGLDGLIAEMRKGRTSLRELVSKPERYDHLTRDVGELEQLAISLLLRYPRSFVVSAQAYLLALELQDGISVSEAAAASGMSVELAHEALEELDNRAMVTRRRDGLVVTKAVCRRYIETAELRYDFR
jgi:hypothetical protein